MSRIKVTGYDEFEWFFATRLGGRGTTFRGLQPGTRANKSRATLEGEPA